MSSEIIESFFNYPDESTMDIGGWLIRGHNSRDEYEEFVIHGEWLASHVKLVDGWREWIRWPLERKSPLLHTSHSL